MTEIISLNKIVKLFKAFQTTHPVLNDFGFGQPYMIGESRKMLFPYMWATLTPSTISLLNKTSIPTINFTIIFADKLDDLSNDNNELGEESTNGLEVLSDTLQIAQDFIAYVGNDLNQYGIMLQGDATIEPVEDESDDKVNGVALSIQLRLKHSNCIYDV